MAEVEAQPDGSVQVGSVDIDGDKYPIHIFPVDFSDEAILKLREGLPTFIQTFLEKLDTNS